MADDKMTRLLSRPWVQMASAYAAVIALCLVILTWVLGLTHADLTIPFQDGWDVTEHSMLVKSVLDTGWAWLNPYLGAPFGTQFIDYPFYDNLDLALMRTIAMFTSNYAVVMNLFFLATFPLTVVCSMLALRSFDISYLTAIVISLLYAFVPYHFYQGEAHLFVAAYFLLPLMTMVILWLWTGQFTRQRLIPAIIISALVGSVFGYYVFFSCYFLTVAAVIAAIRFKNPERLTWGAALVAVVLVSLIINTSPTWLYGIRHGRNHEVGARGPGESEIWGLKLTHLLLPISGHRLPLLRKIRRGYDRATFRYNENKTATLGTMGDAGFFVLLGWLFCAPEDGKDGDKLTPLAVLSVSAVLLGTIGGLGTIFNFLVHPQIRAYTRISIYIAFFSLFAVALLLDALRRWMGDAPVATWLWRGLLAVVLCIGILDQTNPSFAFDYASLKSDYHDQQTFVDQIEASVPPGAMIFQLPNVLFPESTPLGDMSEYDELRGYLHSHSLKWSSGAMTGRLCALWAAHHGLDIGEQQAETGPDGVRTLHIQAFPLETLNTLVFAGFSGIYVDRHGFWDRGATITSQLKTLLGEQPLLSKDHRLEFFNLTSFAAGLRAKYTPEQWEAERRTALALPPQ
ncbi:MAG TPA: hypothetical protein VN867_08695 [Candidatus Binataceae bacterium]|nr:hypothetical protein [Candidatus Binataceae bacterium]